MRWLGLFVAVLIVAGAVVGGSAEASAASLGWSGAITISAAGGSGANLAAVSCPSATQCTAADDDGQQVTFNPTLPGTPNATAIDPGEAGSDPGGLACPSTSQCTGVEASGREVTFNPVAPSAPIHSVIVGNALVGVSCPSTTQCTAIDGAGHEVTFDPTGSVSPTPATIDPVTTQVRRRQPHDERGVPSTSQCTVVDLNGGEVTFNPTAPGTPSPTTLDASSVLTSVSCPSSSQCTAVDGESREVTFNPTAPGTPTPTLVAPTNPTAVRDARKRAVSNGGAVHGDREQHERSPSTRRHPAPRRRRRSTTGNP